MPGIQDLERFQASFRTLGGELASLSASGESYDDLPLPKEGEIDADLASLLDLEPRGASPIEVSSELPPQPASDTGESLLAASEEARSGKISSEEIPSGLEDQDGGFAFDDFLESLGDDLAAPSPEIESPWSTPEPETPDGEPAELGDLDSSSLDDFSFDLEAFARGEEDAEASVDQGLPDEGEALPEPGLGELDGLGDLDGLDGLSDDFLKDIESPAEQSESVATQSTAGDGFNSEDGADSSLEDFNFPEDFLSDLGAQGDVAASPVEDDAPATELPEEEPFSDFSFGDLSSLDSDQGSADVDLPDVPEELPLGEPVGEESTEDEVFSLFSEEAPEPTVEDIAPAASNEPLSRFADDFDFSLVEPSEEGAAVPSLDATEGTSPSMDFETHASATGPDEAGAAEAAFPGEESLDSFDMFRLDDDFMSTGFGLEGEGETPVEDDLGTLEEFSLEGLDDVYHQAAPSFAAPSVPKTPTVQPKVEVEEFRISEDDLSRLQSTLSSYPLSLRIACEELIVEQVIAPEQTSALVKLLVNGADPKETAVLASKLLGRTIVVPKGFEKHSAEDLEAQKRTLRYALVHQFLPILRIFAAAAVAAALLVFVGIRFIYFPIRAHTLYRQGYEAIPEAQYARANERFTQALRYWVIKKWYYRYAEAFRDAKQYLAAEDMYDSLLSRFPRDKKGALDYAAMEREYLRNYEKASSIVKKEILDWELDDKDGLLSLGDTNLAWGELDPSRYEEARKAFARLIGRYGRKDEYLSRMLLYFIRTDQLSEVLALQAHFMDSPKGHDISASSLAEMGGYLFDKKNTPQEGIPDPYVDQVENLRAIFIEAIRRDPKVPESYYHLTRYFERYGSPTDEMGSAELAVAAFEKAPESSVRRLRYRIDALRRLADLLVRNKEFLNAENRLNQGISLYEDAVKRRILTPGREFGRLYADFGDIEYFSGGNPAGADGYYERAERLGWSTPDMQYRRGYVAYAEKNWKSAVERFYKASADLPLNRRLLFAMGNAMYERGDLYAAQGYYNRLLDVLEAERSRFPSLSPNDRPEHAVLVDRIMRARNNLGVALAALAGRTGEEQYRNRALSLFAESELAWDARTRDPISMRRSESTNLAFLNTRGLLYPTPEFEPSIYTEIDKDVRDPSTWESLVN